MINDRLYVGTIACDSAQVADEYGLGIEVDEFCTASNMDGEIFKEIDLSVRKKMSVSDRHIFHAPFNELFPAAVDPLAVELAFKRFEQSYALARDLGIKRMVVHTGYVPFFYFKSWFKEKSVEFWKRFMSDKPADFSIMIENVLEDEPQTLAEIIEGINDSRVTACLDIGHAFCKSKLELTEWIKVLGPWLGHAHLHNNDMSGDCHWPLGTGHIDMNRVLEELMKNSRSSLTFTVENSQCLESVRWLKDNGWIYEKNVTNDILK